MSRVVIDANVLIAANLRETHVSVSCAAASARFLLHAQDEVILEDTAGMALAEYRRYCHMSGQPGAGDRFLQWFMRARWSAEHVARIDIGETAAEATGRIPPRLRGFDPSDHKWVALYLLGGADVIANSADSDYSEWSAAFADEGVVVRELCAGA